MGNQWPNEPQNEFQVAIVDVSVAWKKQEIKNKVD